MYKTIFFWVMLLFSCLSYAQPLIGTSSYCKETKNILNQKHHYLPVSLGITDTIHVVNYQIHIDTINYTSKNIRAFTKVTVVSKQNAINTIPLSLLQLSVDSVVLPSGPCFFSYNDTTLSVLLPASLNQNDTLEIGVYYHGAPKQDASGWGGFYFSGTYAFNLGVGFAANPHVFGRVWFPCIDEFTDRSTYDFYINTDPGYKAFCNGELISETINPNGTKKWYWKLTETIPTYLASMAVAPFYSLERTSNGIPVTWACLAGDTIKTLNTFSNLDTILQAFISAYGPYPFNKVGYVEIPFNSGAMEHATSIHIGKAFIDGTKSYETLWGHELSHMWWGDKVTCETAGDMWLNEGFASFNEAFFQQVVYGKTAYKNWLRTNHRKVLQFAHTPAQDGAYYSMLNIPENITYGYTVYQKGADMVHTLRYYMGDSMFFDGCKFHLNANAYGNANSYHLRDNLAASSGINMNRFFDDWIFTEGFPHFSIDSVTAYLGALNHYYVHTRQRTKGNSHLYAMPVDLRLTDGVNDTIVSVLIDSVTNTFDIALLFAPTWIALDRDEKISDAISDYEKIITTTGNHIMPETFVSLNVLNSGNNSSQIRIEHNWVTPDSFKGWNQGIRISDYHYWKIDGLFDTGFHSKATFSYNGALNGTNGYVDNTLLNTGTTEDSLVMLYRSGTASDWQLVNGYTRVTGGSVVDKTGSIIIDTLKKGEYVFGIYDYTITGFDDPTVSNSLKLKVNPNPSDNYCHISFDLKNYNNSSLQIFDTTGKSIMQQKLKKDDLYYNWNTTGVKPGTYLINLVSEGKVISYSKFILLK